MQRLAGDLGVRERLLQQAVAFGKLYPRLPPAKRCLRWAHYRELLVVKDPHIRAFYEEQALTHQWTQDRLMEAIRSESHLRMLPDRSGAAGQKKVVTILPRPGNAHRVYKATVEQVIDGETLMVMLDLGFHLYKRQRIRLALVQAPPLSQAKGKDAQAFVQDALAAVQFVMLKSVTLGHDGRATAHVFFEPGARDEGKIFAKGRHLNQELVQRELAQAI